VLPFGSFQKLGPIHQLPKAWKRRHFREARATDTQLEGGSVCTLYIPLVEASTS
jgi:hypothetical protein